MKIHRWCSMLGMDIIHKFLMDRILQQRRLCQLWQVMDNSTRLNTFLFQAQAHTTSSNPTRTPPVQIMWSLRLTQTQLGPLMLLAKATSFLLICYLVEVSTHSQAAKVLESNLWCFSPANSFNRLNMVHTDIFFLATILVRLSQYGSYFFFIGDYFGQIGQSSQTVALWLCCHLLLLLLSRYRCTALLVKPVYPEWYSISISSLWQFGASEISVSNFFIFYFLSLFICIFSTEAIHSVEHLYCVYNIKVHTTLTQKGECSLV